MECSNVFWWRNASLFDVSYGTINMGQLFENKGDLKIKLHAYAMKNNFEFKVKNSGKDIWCVTCIDENCSWRLRVRKLNKSEMFEIWKYIFEHTCTLALRQKDNRQAVPWVIRACIKRKYINHIHNFLPRSIIEDISNDDLP